MKNQKAYILLSGGQDSFVSLLWAIDNFESVEAVSIIYQQKHSKEIEYAKEITKKFNIKHTIYDINNFFNQLTISSLLNTSEHNKQHELALELPASFVPNRNGIFLTIIANHAYKQKEKIINIVIGVCETDYSGYPDCRDNYIKAKSIELSLGLDKPVNIFTPLMWKNKAETFKMAYDFGHFNTLIENTLSCYNGEEKLNEWGRGCDNCPACKLRKKGYYEYIEKHKK